MNFAALRSAELTFMDCDGVIFDSNASKQTAFALALSEYPREAVDRLLQLHTEEGGVSRYVKLRRFFEEIHPVEDPEPAIARALIRFGEASRAAYRELRPVAAALAFAERMGGSRAVVVVSGADQAELREVFAQHRIRDRFADVLGSPTKKQDHLHRVLRERGVAPERAVMIGDGKADFLSAAEVGVPFVFLAEMSDWKDGAAIVGAAPRATIASTWEELSGWLEPLPSGDEQ
jgi:phosphoglycolate phosphatase-like HAD superfamily hydrolase